MRTTFFLVAAALALSILYGCARHSGMQAAFPPGEFPWSAQVLEATGSASVPQDTGFGAQRFFVGQQSAKTAALAELKVQLSNLPVAEDQTIGSLMASNLSIKRAIERQLQTAKVVSQGQPAPGAFEVRVQLPLAPIADVLHQHNISTEGLPPLPEPEPAALAPLS